MRPCIIAAGLVLLSTVGCDGGGETTEPPITPGADAAPPPPPPPSDGGITLPDAQVPEDVVILEPADDEGMEYGMGVTDEAGHLRMYSGEHEVLFEIDLVDEEDTPRAGLEVRVAIDAEGSALLLAMDPSGELMPLPIHTTLPDADSTLEVHGRDVMHESRVFDPSENPFAPAFSLGGLLSGTAVRVILRGVVIPIVRGVVVNALLDVAENVCRSSGFSPTTCRWASRILGYAAALVPGLGNVRLGQLRWRELPSTLLTEVGPMLAAHVLCEDVPRALVSWSTGAAGDVALELAREEYQEVLSMQLYMMWRVANDPPDDPAAVEEIVAETERTLVLVSELSRIVRPDYVEMYQVEEPTPMWFDGVLMSSALNGAVETAATMYGEDPTLLDLSRRLDSGLIARLRTLLRSGSRLDRALVAIEERAASPRTTSPWLLGCAVAAVKGVSAVDPSGATASFATAEIIRGLSELARLRLEALWDRHYSGPPPVPDCRLDFHEPNGRWSDVASRPVSTLGDTPLTDLSLCAPDGTGGETDWYAFSMPFLSYRISAELLGVPDGLGQDAEVCMDVWYWDEALELIGDSPTLVRGETCGTIGTGVTIPRFAVSRTTGVTWSTLFVRVRPADGEPAPDGVDYSLRFTL